MTTEYVQKVKCSMCGAKHPFPQIMSSNSFGPMDLDTRPAPMLRYTIDTWVQVCTSCGFANGTISEKSRIEMSYLQSREYLTPLPGVPENSLAHSFLKAAKICEKEKKHSEAQRFYLYAAWSCDDLEAKEGAKQCRLKVLEYFSKYKIQMDPTSAVLMQIDLLRRSEQFEKAEELTGETLKKSDDWPEFLVKILEYQQELIQNRDAACHTIPN